MPEEIIRRKRRLSSFQIIILGFAGVILLGALLLMLPISTTGGNVTPFNETLFTATSAVCVTGLVVQDTGSYWSTFGQAVILALIQIGGLGVVTVAASFALLSGRRISLMQRSTMQDAISAPKVGGIVRLTRFILRGTFLIELLGALAVLPVFCRDYGWRGVWMAVFHSISAFCNAGFDLMGENGAYQSLIRYSDDWLVNTVIMLLIIIGGIGFLVWDDLSVKKFQWKKYHLHTKIVLSTTGFLIIGGAVLFLILEKNNVLAGMPVKEQILCSLFHSVTARTAGFNTTDTGALTEGSKLVTMILMFIGGSPGSTAGGIKTTTVVVLIVFVRANLMEAAGCNVFNRRLDETAIRKASVVMCTNLFLILTGTIFMEIMQPFSLSDVMFEVFSAMGTVGMSAGITRDVCMASRMVLVFLMFCGRIGSLTFALSLKGHRHGAPIRKPVEEITIG